MEPVLSVGRFRLARLTTDSHQGEESLDLSLLVLASFCWQSQASGKRGAVISSRVCSGTAPQVCPLVLWVRSGCVGVVSSVEQITKVGISPEERACLDTAGLPGIA